MSSAMLVYSAGRCRLRILFRIHFRRLIKFTVAGTLTTLVGVGVYYVEVSQLDANKYLIRPVNWPIMTLLGFMLNWFIWRERQASRKLSGLKWYAVAGAFSAASFSLFVLLTTLGGMEYLAAQVTTAAILGIPHYFISDRGIFKRKDKTETA